MLGHVIDVFYTHECFACMYLYALCVHRTLEDKGGSSDPLELELEMLMSCCVVLERNVGPPHPCAPPPVPYSKSFDKLHTDSHRGWTGALLPALDKAPPCSPHSASI